MRTLICASFFVFVLGNVVAQIPVLRTDGYYYYYNGAKTIIPFTTGGRITVSDVAAELALQHNVQFREVGDNYGALTACIPQGVIVTEGSIFTHYVRFFSNEDGICGMAFCLGAPVVDAVNRYFDRVFNGLEKSSDKITMLSVGKMGEIHFEVNWPPALKEVYKGKILSDGLELYVECPAFPKGMSQPSFLNVMRRYKFYKFGTYPPFEK